MWKQTIGCLRYSQSNVLLSNFQTKQIVGEKILLNVLIAGVPGIAIFILLPSALFWQVTSKS